MRTFALADRRPVRVERALAVPELALLVPQIVARQPELGILRMAVQLALRHLAQVRVVLLEEPGTAVKELLDAIGHNHLLEPTEYPCCH